MQASKKCPGCSRLNRPGRQKCHTCGQDLAEHRRKENLRLRKEAAEEK